jgi:RNA polymerase sigma factor (sigma-70 family)
MGARNLRRISDARLVQAARAGDPRAFDELYRRHQPAVLSFCRHLTGRLEDAEDAVQHTFLNAYRAITADTAELDLKPWLFTVARNRCLSLLRSRRLREPAAALRTARHPLPAPEEAAADAWGVEGLAEEVERREDLRELVADLGELPEPQRAALVLSELEALSHAQIAQVLDVAPAKVRALVFQARSSLISTREARETPCGQVRMQISTLRGPSLRRRTLRRHVRACPGCREFEAAVQLQRRDLAVILPVLAAATARDGVPTALAGGAGSGGAAAVGGGAAGGGAAAAGGGLLGGVVTAVAGGGAVQFTALMAVAAAGTLGLVKADVPDRLGIVDVVRVERAQGAPDRDGRGPAQTRLAGQDGRVAQPGESGTRDLSSPERGGSANAGPSAGAGRNRGSDRARTPPGLAEKDGAMPPGLAKQDGPPPGLAKKGDDPPPGWAHRRNGNGNGNGGGQKPKSVPPGQGSEPGAKPTPPGQARKDAGTAPAAPGGETTDSKPLPPGQAGNGAAPPGQGNSATPDKPEKPAKPK